jgi:hypothetical protein
MSATNRVDERQFLSSHFSMSPFELLLILRRAFDSIWRTRSLVIFRMSPVSSRVNEFPSSTMSRTQLLALRSPIPSTRVSRLFVNSSSYLELTLAPITGSLLSTLRGRRSPATVFLPKLRMIPPASVTSSNRLYLHPTHGQGLGSPTHCSLFVGRWGWGGAFTTFVSPPLLLKGGF